MSDQNDTSSAITNLEEVFLSRDFGDSSAPYGPVLERARRNREDVSVPGVDSVRSLDSQLEHIFLSDRFGKPVPAVRTVPDDLLRPRVEKAVIVPFPGPTKDHMRVRAIAAVSGIAAAVIVLAGLASAPGHGGGSGAPALSAAGSAARSTTDGPAAPGGSSSSTSTGGVGAVNVSTAGAAPEAHLTEKTGRGPTVTTGSPAEAGPMTVEATPGSGARNAGAGGAPAPAQNPSPPTPSGGLSGVTAAVGNTATTVGTTINTTANQLVSTVPATAPVGGAVNDVGATVTGLGQSVG